MTFHFSIATMYQRCMGAHHVAEGRALGLVCPGRPARARGLRLELFKARPSLLLVAGGCSRWRLRSRRCLRLLVCMPAQHAV